MPRSDGELVLFFPITTKQPEALRFAVEIPAIEKRRAGLDVDRRVWIIIDEFNTDIIGSSFYLEPEPPTGRFSKAFFLPPLREFINRRRSAKRSSDSADLPLAIASLPVSCSSHWNGLTKRFGLVAAFMSFRRK
ncbi:hypothetical protein [Sinorhizobium alkalisoli]|uniref:hypothetical protein n=1 Tax=Sinorhizobium alkalisoli TaxID=1752398 RepID=UPI001FD91B16|nr:hypothetical protein [Sinorhizobium alkalisoli]